MSRKRVQRVTDWDDARYSVLPARVALDERLTAAHFRVLAYLGRVNTRDGWCELSQKAAADVLGIGRQAVNRAFGDLVEWGFVERRGQKETRSALCQYRVKIDGDVSPTDDTPTCRPPTTHVSPTDDTRVASSSDTLLDHRSKIIDQDRSSILKPDVGAKMRPAQPARYVSEDALNKVRSIAPGWDRQELLRRFLLWDGSKRADDMDRAFLGWVRKATARRVYA